MTGDDRARGKGRGVVGKDRRPPERDQSAKRKQRYRAVGKADSDLSEAWGAAYQRQGWGGRRQAGQFYAMVALLA